MNNNFTHKEFKNFVLKVLDILTSLPVLPAGPWFAVNFLLVPYNNLLRLPAISQSAISKFLRSNKAELKLKPAYVIHELCSYKKAYQ